MVRTEARNKLHFTFPCPRSACCPPLSLSRALRRGTLPGFDAQAAPPRGGDVLQLLAGDAAHEKGEEGLREAGEGRAAPASLLNLLRMVS